MSAARTCPECGAALPADAPKGFCPACLVRAGRAYSPSKAATSPGPLFQLPRAFGDYELLEEIARGGMGVVYKARQIGLNRAVAVKMILSGAFASRDFVRRFQAEAETVARLRHPNIVAIHEVGEHDGQPFFSMDYIEGRNLAELVREHPLPATQAARYLRAIAQAVHYAHEHGVLHRDLKPDNILIDLDDEPRVTDFGLAKRVASPSELRVESGGAARGGNFQLSIQDSLNSLTLTGQVLGSPSYAPPEQAGGRHAEIGPASDVYSLGAILYHLLVGRPPFAAATLETTLALVLNTDAVSPRVLNPSVPRDLETICLKCLEKEPARRYGTAKALAEELDRYLSDEPIRARPVNQSEKLWRWARRNPKFAFALGGVMVLLLVVAIGSPIAAYRINRARQQAEQNLYAADMNVTQQALDEGNLGRARSLIEAHRPAAGQKDLRGFEWRYFWKLCQGDSLHTLQGHSNGVFSVAFSPDGQMLASGGYNDCVKIWDVGSRRLLITLPTRPDRISSVAFSPDGTILGTGSEEGVSKLWRVNTWELLSSIEGGSARIVFSPTSPIIAIGTGSDFLGAGNGSVKLWNYKTSMEIMRLPEAGGRAAFSPDGKTLATGMWEDQIKLWDISSGRQTGSIDRVGGVVSLAFSPDGRILATSNWKGLVQLWDVATTKPVAILSGHRARVWSLAFSPNGDTLATGSSDQTVRLWNVASRAAEWGHLQSDTAIVTLTNHLQWKGHGSEVWSVSFSPDGRLLASGGMDQKVMLWSTIPKVQSVAITNTGVSFFAQPIFHPNGRLLLTRNVNQAVTIWDINTGQPVMVMDGEQVPLDFSLDGKTVLTLNTNGLVKSWDVASRKNLGTFAVPPSQFPRGRLSPDKRVLAVGGGPDCKVTLWNIEKGALMGELQGRVSAMTALAFSPDGRTLATAAEFETCARLWDLTTQRELGMLGGHRHAVFALAFAPDGRTLATGSIDHTAKLWDVASRNELAVLSGHKEGIHGLAFAPDGKTLATANDDHTIKLWNLVTRREVATLKQSKPVWFVAFSPDGRTLASSGVTPVGPSVIERGAPLVLWSAPSFAEIEAWEPAKHNFR